MEKLKKTFVHYLLVFIGTLIISSFLSGCNRSADYVLKGEVIAVLNPCIGNELIISIVNNADIGTNNDCDNNRFFVVASDTLFEYSNVVAVPLPFGGDGQPRYFWRNKAINIQKGDYIEFEYRMPSEKDSLLFFNSEPCLASYAPPSNIRRLVITKIIKFNQ